MCWWRWQQGRCLWERWGSTASNSFLWHLDIVEESTDDTSKESADDTTEKSADETTEKSADDSTESADDIIKAADGDEESAEDSSKQTSNRKLKLKKGTRPPSRPSEKCLDVI